MDKRDLDFIYKNINLLYSVTLILGFPSSNLKIYSNHGESILLTRAADTNTVIQMKILIEKLIHH